MSDRDCIILSLVSHTNVGKTTLARTLLRRDVGEVRDEAQRELEEILAGAMEAILAAGYPEASAFLAVTS